MRLCSAPALLLVGLELALLWQPVVGEEDVPVVGLTSVDDTDIVDPELPDAATDFHWLYGARLLADNVTAAGGSAGGGSGGHAHTDYSNVIYYMIVAGTLGMLSYWVLDIFHLPFPYTVVVFVEGLCVGVLHFGWNVFSTGKGPLTFLDAGASGASGGQMIDNFGRSINVWANIDAHLLLYAFLPILLFGDSMSLNWEVLKGCFPQCLFLAGPGVALGSAASAVIAKYIMPYDWDWATAATFGSILAATDPVAVVGILKELGCSKVLTMQIAGESLLNDGTAVVFFTVFKKMMLEGHQQTKDIVTPFIVMPFGAVIVGCVIGVTACFFTSWCADRFQHSSDILQLATPLIAAYWAFFFGEHELGVSGVLATVFAAFTMTRVVWPIVLDEHGMHAFWHMMEFLANTLIFFLSGTITAKSVTSNVLTSKDVGFLFILYLCVTVIRFVMMYSFYPILTVIGMGTNVKDLAVMSWGGLRGAVGLALALQINASTPTATTTLKPNTGAHFVFHIGGIACLTLLINATTCKKLVEALGMTRRNWAKDELLNHLQLSQRRQTLMAYKALASTSRFKQHHHGLIKRWVSALRVDDEDGGGRHGHDHHNSQTKHSMARIRNEGNVGIALGSVESLKEEVESRRKRLPPDRQNKIGASLRTQRELYYSIVRSSYADMTKSGMLPSHSRAVLRLQNSVDFGEARSHKPLCDLAKLTRLISVGHRWGSMASFVQNFWAWKEGYNINTDFVPIRRKNVVFDLYDIITFIDAHQAAERQIARLKIKQDDELYVSMQMVVLESRSQCHQAMEFLERNRIGSELVALVRTLQLALHLLYGEEHRIIELLNIGAVSERDLHDLKHEVQHDSQALFKSCLEMQRQLEDTNVFEDLVFPDELNAAHTAIQKEAPRAVGGQRMSMYDKSDRAGGRNDRYHDQSSGSNTKSVERQALVKSSRPDAPGSEMDYDRAKSKDRPHKIPVTAASSTSSKKKSPKSRRDSRRFSETLGKSRVNSYETE